MYLNANDASFSQSSIDCDIAIVGGGPAGITLAQQFKNTPFKICLLESGGFEASAATQQLADGSHGSPSAAIPENYSSQHSQRLWGGTGSVWGGFCREMDAIDFEQRGLPFDHQWPITLENIKPFYTWHALDRKLDRKAIASTRLEVRHYERVLYPFNVLHKEEFSSDKNIQVIINASVTDIIQTNKTSISHLNAVNTGTVDQQAEKSFQIKAKAYVLACGGIGNVKLLLNANGVSKHGIGNEQDQVGRRFMEHPHFQFYDVPALLYFSDTDNYLKIDKRYKPAFYLNDATRRDTKRLNFCAMVSRPFNEPSKDSKTSFPGSKLYRPNFSKITENPGSFYTMAFRSEQMPNPESRVTLGNEKDALGMRRTHLDWKLTEFDKNSLIENIYQLADELGQASLGRVQLRLDESKLWQTMVGGGHLMGTTAMGIDPKTSVVDANCKIHSVDNLFMAGSSVFATSGVSNPTLTLMALARRLGVHLQDKLRDE